MLGQIALVLASSLSTAFLAPDDFVVGLPLEMAQAQGQAQAQTGGRGRKVECQERVRRAVLALINMGTALVKQFDWTGNEKDMDEAGVLYKRAVVVAIGKSVREVKVGREHMGGVSKMKRDMEMQRVKQRGLMLHGCRNGGEDEGEHGHEHGDRRGEVLVRLEMLGESLGERGFVV